MTCPLDKIWDDEIYAYQWIPEKALQADLYDKWECVDGEAPYRGLVLCRRPKDGDYTAACHYYSDLSAERVKRITEDPAPDPGSELPPIHVDATPTIKGSAIVWQKDDVKWITRNFGIDSRIVAYISPCLVYFSSSWEGEE